MTGGSGFIGGRLAERLASEHGARVRVLVRTLSRCARVARSPVELLAGDVTDAGAVQRAAQDCEVLFHCAYGNTGSAAEMRRVDVEGARNVLDAGLEQSARVVNVGTLSVYGVTPDGDLDERAHRSPDGEAYARRASSRRRS